MRQWPEASDSECAAWPRREWWLKRAAGEVVEVEREVEREVEVQVEVQVEVGKGNGGGDGAAT